MEIKFENFVEDIKKYNAGEIKCEFDFPSIAVKKIEEGQKS
jgi:hypothetical protein